MGMTKSNSLHLMPPQKKQVGDHVNGSWGEGIILKVLPKGRIKVRRERDRQVFVLYERSTGYIPTPAEIEARAAECRMGWSEREHWRRTAPSDRTEPVEVQVVADEMVHTTKFGL